MHEGQANAETALLALDRAAALHEEIEHVRQQVERQSLPIIGDIDDDLVASATGGNPYVSTGRRVPGGVR